VRVLATNAVFISSNRQLLTIQRWRRIGGRNGRAYAEEKFDIHALQGTSRADIKTLSITDEPSRTTPMLMVTRAATFIKPTRQ